MKKNQLKIQRIRQPRLEPPLLASVLAAFLAAPLAGCGGSQSQPDTSYPAEPAQPAASDPYAAEDQPQEAQASGEEQPQPAAGHEAPTGPVGEEQIKKFAQAHPEVMEIQNRYQQPIQQAQSQEQAQQLQQQAIQELTEAVQRHGLTIEEFNHIGEAARTDPAVLQQVEKELGGE